MGTGSVRSQLKRPISCSTCVDTFYSEGNLERALQQKTGISEDAIIAYLPDGRRLTTDNVRELAGAAEDVGAQCLLA